MIDYKSWNPYCSPSGKPSGLQACIHSHKDRKERTTSYNKREREILRIVELCKKKKILPSLQRSGLTFHRNPNWGPPLVYQTCSLFRWWLYLFVRKENKNGLKQSLDFSKEIVGLLVLWHFFSNVDSHARHKKNFWQKYNANICFFQRVNIVVNFNWTT